MAKTDLGQKTKRKIRPTREVSVAFHMTLNEEEGIAFEKERERLGFPCRSSKWAT